MGTVNRPPDFREFLRLFDMHCVEYLLIGGYAVAYHSYPHATADMKTGSPFIPKMRQGSSRRSGLLGLLSLNSRQNSS